MVPETKQPSLLTASTLLTLMECKLELIGTMASKMGGSLVGVNKQEVKSEMSSETITIKRDQ